MSLRMQGAYGNGGPPVSHLQPGRGNGLVFALVGILVGAIIVLAYLVLTK
jgi:hypothetical protein